MAMQSPRDDERRISRASADWSPDCLLAIDARLRILWANRTAAKTFHYPRQKMMGMAVARLIPRRSNLGSGEIWYAIQEKEPWSGTIRCRRANGTMAEMNCSIAFPGGSAGPVFATLSIRDQTDLEMRYKRLKDLSITDELTGVYNVRYFWARLHYEFVRSRRYAQPLACLIADLDRFKAVNDVLGHRAGDQVLREVARAVRGAVREVDVVSRYGGDEIALILPNTDANGATRCAEKVRRTVARIRFPGGKGAAAAIPGRLAVSIGVAVLTDDATDEETLLRRADAALMRAKREGRDRVCLWEPRRRSRSSAAAEVARIRR